MGKRLNKKGAILIYLLILISVLFFLVFHGIFYSKLNYKLATNYVENKQNYEKLKFIVNVIAEIIKNQNLYNDFFEDGFLKYYEKENVFKIDNEKLFLKLEKESDKININSADDAKIKDTILKQFEENFPYEYLDSISDKILDWRDKDNYVRLHGAEKEDYKDYGYYPANDKFHSIFELLYVKNMKTKLFFYYDKKEKKYSGLLTIFTIYGANTYRCYLKFKQSFYIVFFNIGKNVKIFEWRKLKI